MVVCHCWAVNDARIRDEIATGALDAEAISDRCGAGSRCGGCMPALEALVERITGTTPLVPAGRVPAGQPVSADIRMRVAGSAA